MLKLTINGESALIAKLNKMPDGVRRSILRKVTALAFKLEAVVKRKLTNQVLRVRTGRLRDSVFRRVIENKTSIRGEVLAGKGVPYAAIHEYGGTVPAMTIYPKRANVLAFVMNGKMVFAKHVNRPLIRIPERSYMRSSLRDMGAMIKSELIEAAREGVKK